MKQPVLLCYNLPQESYRKLRLAAMRLKIRVRAVKPWELTQTLEALAGSSQPLAQADPCEGAFADEMLVMAYFPAGMGNAFLRLARQSGVPSIPLKAVLTPTNSQWDSITLHAEISKERAAIEQGLERVHNPD